MPPHAPMASQIVREITGRSDVDQAALCATIRTLYRELSEATTRVGELEDRLAGASAVAGVMAYPETALAVDQLAGAIGLLDGDDAATADADFAVITREAHHYRCLSEISTLEIERISAELAATRPIKAKDVTDRGLLGGIRYVWHSDRHGYVVSRFESGKWFDSSSDPTEGPFSGEAILYPLPDVAECIVREVKTGDRVVFLSAKRGAVVP